MGGWLGEWVGQWVGSHQIIKNRVNRHLIKIIELCLKIYDLWRHPSIGGCMGYCVGQWVGSCQITRNSIIRKLIKIIQFCLKVFRWFKFTLKPPNRIRRGKLRLAIWDTSLWTFWVKFRHNGR